MSEPIYEPSKTVERIKSLRDAIGISAEFLNDKCKISKNTISKSFKEVDTKVAMIFENHLTNILFCDNIITIKMIINFIFAR